MNHNRKYNKIVAVAISALLVISSMVGCQSNSDNRVGASCKNINNKKISSSGISYTSSLAKRKTVVSKEETVYVNADASGTTRSIIVSNWLKNGNGSLVITDTSSLRDIVNVKGEETYTAQGNTLNWAANGADIYYQGTSKEELPVKLKITYTLDGKEMSPRELAGKTGHMKIRMDYTNMKKQVVTVDGKKVETVVPFAVLGGTLLDSKKFTNVTVTNGKVISDGKHTIVAGIALPGVKECLLSGMDDVLGGIDIPSTVEIEADVTDFELSMTLSVVLNNLLGDIDVTQINGIEKLKGKLEEMTSSYDKIVNGTEELYKYMGDLVTGVKELNTGATKLAVNSPKIEDAANTIAYGIASAKAGSSKLTQGAKLLHSATSKLSTGTTKVANGITKTKDAIDELVAAYEGNSKAKGLKQGMTELSAGATAINSGVTTLNTGLDSMYTMITESIKTNTAQITILTTIAGKLKTGESLTSIEQQILANATLGGKTLETSIAALNGANQALQQMKDGIDNKDMMKQVDTLNEGTSSLASAASVAAQGVFTMYDANRKLQSGLVVLNNGAGDIDSGAQTIAKNMKALSFGASTLDGGLLNLASGYSKFKTAILTYSQGVNALSDGIGSLEESSLKLQEGARTLYDGTKQFKEKAIDKITEAVNTNFEQIKDKLVAIVKADQSYHTYSGANEDMECSVKFIIETEGISTNN